MVRENASRSSPTQPNQPIYVVAKAIARYWIVDITRRQFDRTLSVLELPMRDRKPRSVPNVQSRPHRARAHALTRISRRGKAAKSEPRWT